MYTYRKDKPAYYVGARYSSWLDPDSWHDTSLPSPVPHTHRIPCATDQALFPRGQAFKVESEIVRFLTFLGNKL